MPPPAPVLDGMMTTPGGALLVLAIVLPVVGALLAFAAGGRAVERIALATMPPGLALAIAIGWRWRSRVGPSSICSAGGSRRSAWRCAPMDWRRS